MLINVNNVNQAESHKWVRHIFKNTYDTCFISNFSREIDWEWSQICQRPLSHAHRRRQRQPGRVPQVGTPYFQKHIWHMFYIQFFKRNRLGMVSDMSEASKSCPSTLTKTASGSTTAGSSKSSKTCMALVWLGLVDVVDVDEHDLEASDIFETIPNRFLLKNWI